MQTDKIQIGETKKDEIHIDEILYPNLLNKVTESYDNLKEQLSKHGDNGKTWAFCLGAGVSISCNIPDWASLLAKIYGNIMKSYSNITDSGMDDFINVISSMKNNQEFSKRLEDALEGKDKKAFANIDLLEFAEYIKVYIKRILEERDKGNGKLPKQKSPEQKLLDQKLFDKVLIQYVKKSCKVKLDDDGNILGYPSSTLEAIVEIMVSKNIKRAVTYNYDNLLEISLRKRLEEDNDEGVQSIIPDERIEFSSQINDFYKVYHCHGRVSVLVEKEENGKVIPVEGISEETDSEKIILTESSYYEEESNSYSLSNVLQSYAMDYCHLIFVGFSGADYTFRRIVRGMSKDDKDEKDEKQYIFFCVDDIVKGVMDKYNEEKGDNLTITDFIKKINSNDGGYVYEKYLINHIIVAKHEYWHEKGFEVIWSTIFELPATLKNLCQ